MAKKKKLEERKNCFMYLSTEGDLFHAEEREQKQYRYIMEYARAHNIHIVKVFHRDVAAQAVIDHHYAQMVEMVRKGKADGIIVASMMCIARDIPDAFKKIGQLKVAGGVMVSVDDGDDLDMDIKEVESMDINIRRNAVDKVMEIFRGDVIYAVLNGVPKSSVQNGERPCIVLSNNKSNHYSTILNVYPLTHKLKHNPVHVIVNPDEVRGYLASESDFLGEQPMTIDRKQVVSKVGHIDEDSDLMRELEQAIARQFDFRFVGRE